MYARIHAVGMNSFKFGKVIKKMSKNTHFPSQKSKLLQSYPSSLHVGTKSHYLTCQIIRALFPNLHFSCVMYRKFNVNFGILSLKLFCLFVCLGWFVCSWLPGLQYFIKHSKYLCQFFTISFSWRNVIFTEKIPFLIQEIADIFERNHWKSVVVVDRYGTTWIVGKYFNIKEY